MRLPSYRWRFVHLAALWAYGVSQPVFSMLKGNPEFLVVRGSTRTDVVVFALILVVAPPLVTVGVERLVSLVSATLARALHMVAIWTFGFLAALQLVGLFHPESRATLLAPMFVAALVGLAYVRSRAFRSFLSVSLALPVAGLLAFVATVPLAVDDRPAADVEVASSTPVVLVVFDEFPLSSLMRGDGSLDEKRYPNFARLAQSSTWYPRATSVDASTTQAVPAILTGIRPQGRELPSLEDHPDNLFTLLGKRYSFRVFEEVTRLCPSRYCPRTRDSVPLIDRQRGLFYDVFVGYLHRVLPSSMRAGLPPIGERWGGFASSDADARELVLGALDLNAWNAALARARSQRLVQFDAFLRSLRPVLAPRTLYFEHALLPHSPWAFLPSGREYGSALTMAGMDEDWLRWGLSRTLVRQALQRHLLQVGYVDRLVGLLLERLEAAGLYDRALVIVTADHGASFRPGGYAREPSPANLADIAGVPLFVKYPGQRRARVDVRHAETIDILPTIADVIGARVQWHVDGRSLRATPIGRRVSVGNFEGDVVTGAADSVEQGVLATARRNAALFGEGRDSLYRLGPHIELLGQSVATLDPTTVSGAAVRFDDESQFANVSLGSLFSPAHVLGEIQGLSSPIGAPLAVAVNGRVAAMTTTFEQHGRTRFDALVPETVFREGTNAVGVYVVTAVAGSTRLGLLRGGSPGLGQNIDSRKQASGGTGTG